MNRRTSGAVGLWRSAHQMTFTFTTPEQNTTPGEDELRGHYDSPRIPTGSRAISPPPVPTCTPIAPYTTRPFGS